jgi:hypothetical protein
VTGGRCDEARPDLAILADRISDNEMVIFEDSSHLASIEERELYLRTIDEFLARVEAVEISCRCVPHEVRLRLAISSRSASSGVTANRSLPQQIADEFSTARLPVSSSQQRCSAVSGRTSGSAPQNLSVSSPASSTGPASAVGAVAGAGAGPRH